GGGAGRGRARRWRARRTLFLRSLIGFGGRLGLPRGFRLIGLRALDRLFFRFRRLALGPRDLGARPPLRLARLGLAAEPGDRPAGLLDLLARRLGEVVRAHSALLGELPLAEDLQVG